MRRRPLHTLALLALLALAATATLARPQPPLPGNDGPSVDDALLPGKSKWAGTDARDEAHDKGGAHAVRLEVSRRSGDKFTAAFWIDGDAGVTLKGTVDEHGQVDCVPTQVLKGKWPRKVLSDHWHGKAGAESLTLTRPAGDGVGRTATLARDPTDGVPPLK